MYGSRDDGALELENVQGGALTLHMPELRVQFAKDKEMTRINPNV